MIHTKEAIFFLRRSRDPSEAMMRRAAVSQLQEDMQDRDMGNESDDVPIGSERGSQFDSPIPPPFTLLYWMFN